MSGHDVSAFVRAGLGVLGLRPRRRRCARPRAPTQPSWPARPGGDRGVVATPALRRIQPLLEPHLALPPLAVMVAAVVAALAAPLGRVRRGVWFCKATPLAQVIGCVVHASRTSTG